MCHRCWPEEAKSLVDGREVTHHPEELQRLGGVFHGFASAFFHSWPQNILTRPQM